MNSKYEAEFSPTNLSIGTQVCQKHIQDALDEAESFPNGSRERRAWLAEVNRLRKRMDRENEIDE